MPHAPLAELLLDAGALPRQALQAALQRQQAEGASLGTALLEEHAFSEQELLGWLARHHGLPLARRADLDNLDNLVAELKRCCPLVVAQSYQLVPYKLSDNTLWVVVHEKIEPYVLEKLERRLRLSIRCALTCEPRLRRAMAQMYGTELPIRFAILLEQLDHDAAPYAADDDDDVAWVASALAPAPVQVLRGSPTPVATPEGGDAEPAATLRRLRQELRAAQDRDTIVQLALQAAAAVFEFTALFLVQANSVRGWRSIGAPLTERIATINVPVALPSVFQTVYATHGHYLGPLLENTANLALLDGLGRAVPQTALVAPIRIGGKLAAILYADNGSKRVPHQRVTALLLLMNLASMGLDALVRRRKKAGAEVADTGESAAQDQKIRIAAEDLAFSGSSDDEPGATVDDDGILLDLDIEAPEFDLGDASADDASADDSDDSDADATSDGRNDVAFVAPRSRIPRESKIRRFDDICAGILVGGFGTRLGGVDKARLRRDANGPTYVQNQVDGLLPRVRHVVLLGRQAQHFDDIACVLLADGRSGCGPMGGLEALLAHCDAPWCWLLACDLPLFDATLIDSLADARRSVTPAAVDVVDVVVPRSAHGLEPTAALYHRRALAAVRCALDAGHYSMQRLIAALPHAVVPLADSQQISLTNINQPEDLQRLHRS